MIDLAQRRTFLRMPKNWQLVEQCRVAGFGGVADQLNYYNQYTGNPD